MASHSQADLELAAGVFAQAARSAGLHPRSMLAPAVGPAGSPSGYERLAAVDGEAAPPFDVERTPRALASAAPFDFEAEAGACSGTQHVSPPARAA
jgi:hypothetical protein